MKKAFAVCLVVGGLFMTLMAFSGLAGAQNSVTTSFSISDYLNLTLSTATIDFGAVTPGNTYGGAGSTDVVATVKANRSYTLSYTAPANFTGNPSGSLAIGSLRWNGTAFTTGANFVTNQPATGLDGVDYTHTYTLVVPNQALDNASYSANIAYTLAPGS